MKRYYFILFIQISLIITSCNSKKNPDQTASVKPSNVAIQIPMVHETESTVFLKKMNDRLLTDYNNARGIEEKSIVLSKYETEMNKHLQTNNQEIDSIPVRVELIDSALTDFLYLRFSNPYADFVCSLQKETINKDAALKKLIQTLNKGAKTFINFNVQSLKVNEPANILPTFEMEGNLVAGKTDKDKQ